MNEKPFEERSQTEELRRAMQEMLAEDNPQVKNLAAASKKQLAREVVRLRAMVKVIQNATRNVRIDGHRFGHAEAFMLMTYKEVDGDGIPYRTYPGTHPTLGGYFTRGTSRDPYARYSEEGAVYVDNMERLLRKFDSAKALVPAPIHRKAALEAQQRIAELESFRTAYMEWSDKTYWVQTDKRFDVLTPWGKHRADVLKEYIKEKYQKHKLHNKFT